MAEPTTVADPIAIIGIGCRLAGGGSDATNEIFQKLEQRVRHVLVHPPL